MLGELPRPIIVEVEFLVLGDISHCEKTNPLFALALQYLDPQILSAAVPMVDKSGLVPYESGVQGQPIDVEVVKRGIPRGRVSHLLNAAIHLLAQVDRDQLLFIDGFPSECPQTCSRYL